MNGQVVDLRGRFQNDANNWKGNNAGYGAVHSWLRKWFGDAKRCEACNGTSKRYEWANISGQYWRDRSDFIQLCTSCHRIFDNGDFCGHGHEFTNENTYLTPAGKRTCRACQREYAKRYKRSMRSI